MTVEEPGQKPTAEDPDRSPSTYEKISGLIARVVIIAILAWVVVALAKGCI